MPTNTLFMAVPNPTVGGDSNSWGTELNTCITAFDTLAVYNVVSVSATGSLGVFNGPALIKANATGGAIVLTLPDSTVAANKGRVYIVAKVDSSGNSVTLQGFGGQTISGAANVVLNTQWTTVTVQLDGANVIALDAGDVALAGDLGGTPASPTVVSTHLSSPLPVAQGGTGDATLTLNAVLYGNGTSGILSVGPGAAGTVLTGTGAAPAFSASPTLTALTLTAGISIGTKVTSYGGVATVSNGVPAIYFKVDASTQSAAISGAALFTATLVGQYEISWSAVVTQAATTSSTLGGSLGFQVSYTDNDTNASVTTPQAGAPSAGVNQAYSQTNQGNTVGTQVSGVVIINAKAGAVTYSFDYTSVGGTVMQFAIHAKVTYLGS